MGALITDCRARSVLDSRGKPTLEVTLSAGDLHVSALVPSGKSAGVHEAHELRDENGNGVTKAIQQIEHVIRPAIIGRAPQQKVIDSLMIALDGTNNKSNLGGNSCIGVSIAVCRLAAKIHGMHTWDFISQENGTKPAFPKLYMNLINGGVHAGFRLPFQEYIVVIGKDSPRESYETGKEIFDELGELIHGEFDDVVMGDEGGYSPDCRDVYRPFEILDSIVGDDNELHLAIDAAASEFFENGIYALQDMKYSNDDLLELYADLALRFPLRSIEDPFAEDEVKDFTRIVEALGDRSLIVGDDLTVTNPRRLSRMITEKAGNALIIKPNQIGTLSEVYETVKLARDNDWKIIVSHRSGDTMGTFISDLAVGLGAYGIKAGSPVPPERKVKYERLIEIYENEME